MPFSGSSTLIGAVEEVLEQGRDLLYSLEPSDYTRQLDGPPGASIGAHYRHVLDHFQSLLDGLRRGSVNYDARRRSPVIESSLDAALVATGLLVSEFRRLPAEVLEGECSVVYSVSYAEADAVAVPSTVAREIMFCVGHAIHHFAILKLLCASLSVSLPYEFGVAPSTLKHLETAAAS